jgi:hypothetical protein
MLAGSVQGAVIAGWDFSQFKVPGASNGGGSPLLANYSVYDPNGAGSESGWFGDVTYGSGFLPTAGGGLNCERLPDSSKKGCAPPNVDGPVRSNRSEPFEIGQPSFDARTILLAEGGQTYVTAYAMTAIGSVSPVFYAMTPGGEVAYDWKLSFGGKVVSGQNGDGGQTDCGTPCESTVTVEFSTDGSSYSSISSETLTVEDQRFEVDLDWWSHDEVYVRLGLSPSQAQPVIDNVAIEAIPVPEPTRRMQLLAGLAGLLVLARLRR